MIQTIIGNKFPDAVIPLIDEARVSLDAIVFDWRWYPQDPGAVVQLFNQAIVRAVRRGVRVRAIANNDQIIKTLSEVGCQAKRLKIQNLVHCKLMVIDAGIAIAGSHNYTQSAFETNLELSAIFDDPQAVKECVDFFNNLWTAYG